MSITIRDLSEDGRLKLVEVKGEMDAFLAVNVEKEVEKLIEAGCRGVAFDLSGVNYIDSSGIRVLLSTYKKLGGKANMVKPSARVVKILELADLMDLLKSHATVEEAVAGLSNPE
jgi:anti-sigma B factor antagonist